MFLEHSEMGIFGRQNGADTWHDGNFRRDPFGEEQNSSADPSERTNILARSFGCAGNLVDVAR